MEINDKKKKLYSKKGLPLLTAVGIKQPFVLFKKENHKMEYKNVSDWHKALSTLT